MSTNSITKQFQELHLNLQILFIIILNLNLMENVYRNHVMINVCITSLPLLLVIFCPKEKLLNFLLPQILIYYNLMYSKYGLKAFMTISFSGLILPRGIMIMSHCTSIKTGIGTKQAFLKILIHLHHLKKIFSFKLTRLLHEEKSETNFSENM